MLPFEQSSKQDSDNRRREIYLFLERVTPRSALKIVRINPKNLKTCMFENKDK